MKWGSDKVFQDLKYIFYLEFPPQIEAYIFVSSTEKQTKATTKKHSSSTSIGNRD